MATIDVERRHSIGKENARKAAEQLAEKLRDKLRVNYRWKEDDLVFERTGAKGRIHVTDSVVHVQIDLSLLLRPVKGVVEDRVHRYLDEYLAG